MFDHPTRSAADLIVQQIDRATNRPDEPIDAIQASGE